MGRRAALVAGASFPTTPGWRHLARQESYLAWRHLTEEQQSCRFLWLHPDASSPQLKLSGHAVFSSAAASSSFASRRSAPCRSAPCRSTSCRSALRRSAYRTPIDDGGASDGDRPLPRHLQPHPATPSSRRSNTAPGLPRHVTQPPTEGPVTATRHRAGLTRHPVIELACDGSQRRSCAGGGFTCETARAASVGALDMVDCLAVTRS